MELHLQSPACFNGMYSIQCRHKAPSSVTYYPVRVDDKPTDYRPKTNNSQNGVPVGRSGNFKCRINCVLVNTLACLFLRCRNKVFGLDGLHIKQGRPTVLQQKAVGWFKDQACKNHRWCTQQLKLLCNIFNIYVCVYIYIHTHTRTYTILPHVWGIGEVYTGFWWKKRGERDHL